MRTSDNKRESPRRAANSFSAVATATRDNLVRWSCHRHFRAGDKRNVTGDGQSRGEEHENLFHGVASLHLVEFAPETAGGL
jgi:hypothetical protein